MENFNIEKNLLDLEFQKHLIIASTSIVLLFTYIIAVLIAFVSEQININNIAVMINLCIISTFSIGFFLYLFFKSLFKINKIPKTIRNLKLN